MNHKPLEGGGFAKVIRSPTSSIPSPVEPGEGLG
jgi:hypothetical protein